MRRLACFVLLLLLGAACMPAYATTPVPARAPIVVAAVDIPAGTVVTFDMISQRSVPSSVLTSSTVKPDSASYIVNQKVMFPVLQGDALYWSMFETTNDKAALAACAKVMPALTGTAEEQVAQARNIALER